MRTIAREELKQKIEQGEKLAFWMASDPQIYQKVHIPGSEVFQRRDSLEKVDPDGEIIVYCINQVCYTSFVLYAYLRSQGYTNVRRYSGGIEDWEAAGYPLAGSLTH